MKIIISERQLNLISEQLPWWGGVAAEYSTNMIDIPAVGSTPSLNIKTSDKDKVKDLFVLAKSWPSTTQDWNSIKNIASSIHKELSGLGSGNFLSLLSQINTKGKLSALLKNWKYDNLTLYQWLESEYGLSWSSIVKVLEKNFKNSIVYSKTPSLKS